jgi:hypothetical protein
MEVRFICVLSGKAAKSKTIHFIRSLPPDYLPKMQRACAFFQEGNKGACKHLGNWTQGYQMCKSKDAQYAEMRRIEGLKKKGELT